MGNKHSRRKCSTLSPDLKTWPLNGDLTPPLNGLHCSSKALMSSVSVTTSYTSSTEKLTTESSKKTGNGTLIVESKKETSKEASSSYKENRNFTRSFSLSSSCGNSEATLKFVSSATDRRFSLDDALDENEEDYKPERTSSLGDLLDGDYDSGNGIRLERNNRDIFHQKAHKSEMKTSSVEKMTTEEKKLYTMKKHVEDMSSSTSCLSKMKFFSKGSRSVSSQNLQLSDVTEISQNHMKSSSPSKFLSRTVPDSAERLTEDLNILVNNQHTPEVEAAKSRVIDRMDICISKLKTSISRNEVLDLLRQMNDLIRKCWEVCSWGYELGTTICANLRNKGGLDILIRNLSSEDEKIQFQSARLLEQCLCTDNRAYVVRHGLEQVVQIACACSTSSSVEQSRIGTGILEHLFKHTEATCRELIRLGGLKAILYDCRTCDVETLRHCAAALANLALYGGPDNQEAMIRHKVPVWLFPLAFHQDDHIKYYACLAIAALVSNKEIEASVLQSGTLDLVEPFVTSHTPEEFARSSVAHFHGQSKTWLQKLAPVLLSKNEDARSLAAFHFAMEAGIKKKQGNTAIFHEIGAVCLLKRVASCPNAVASKYAAQALQLIGEEVPHKLSQQVPLWTVEDVVEWVKQINFCQYSQEFQNSRVDGDLLLQINDQILKDDIGITNGILRRRFLRELNQLKRLADYSSCDVTSLGSLLQGLGPEFCQYTYQMLQAGVSRDNLAFLTEEQLTEECGIRNSVHRLKVIQAIRGLSKQQKDADTDEEQNPKSLDVFVSYRRSTGSQLASLLKVHLQLRNFSVFLDVERLEAGKFDNNLVNSVRQARHFLLVLTPTALDRCQGDTDCKDWVHREIVEALKSQCNIIPILDNFQMPDPESLPEDMRAICYFNGVRWIHDYQDACVDKLERFMRGEMNVRSDGPLGKYLGVGSGTPGTPSSLHRAVHPHPHYQRTASNDSDNDSNSR